MHVGGNESTREQSTARISLPFLFLLTLQRLLHINNITLHYDRADRTSASTP